VLGFHVVVYASCLKAANTPDICRSTDDRLCVSILQDLVGADVLLKRLHGVILSSQRASKHDRASGYTVGEQAIVNKVARVVCAVTHKYVFLTSLDTVGYLHRYRLLGLRCA
jgi:hypothetical protein